MTAVDDAGLSVRRAQALERSGWGIKPHLIAPRNLIAWVYLVLVGVGAYQLTAYQGFLQAYRPVVLFAIAVFALYGALFWWFTHRIDRYTTQPASMVVAAFVWGATAATFGMAAQANTPILDLYAKAFGQNWSLNWGAGLTAPFIEETAKGLGVVVLLYWAPRIVRTSFDGFILGAFVGLGFQLAEDLTYSASSAASAFATDPLQASIQTTFLRLVTGVSGHILYSAIFGAGVVYLIGTPAQRRRVGTGLLLVLTAMALHGVWDDAGAIAATISDNVSFVYVLLVVIILVALFIVTRVFALTVTAERAAMRDVMAPEVASGVISEQELDAISGDRKARKAYFKAGPHHRDHRHAKHTFEAIGDLAAAIAKSHGHDSPQVVHARSEVARMHA